MSKLLIFHNDLKNKEIAELCIGGYCKNYTFDQNETARQIYSENILEEYTCESEGKKNTLSLIKNIKPHAFYECMMLILDEHIYSGIDLLVQETCKRIFDIAYLFIEFISDIQMMKEFNLENGYFQMVYNYDPYTLDRESGMSEKRFHLHLNYWPEWELKLKKVNINDLSKYDKINYIDPILVISEQIIYDIFVNENIMGELIKPESIDSSLLPYGMKIRYKNWDVLCNEEFVKEIIKIHKIMKSYYKKIENCFLECSITPSEPWKRNKLNEYDVIIKRLESIKELSEKSKGSLIKLAQMLRDIPPQVMDFLKKRQNLRTSILSMNGLNYSLGLYSKCKNSSNHPLNKHNDIYMVLQPKMFSRIGGAGLPYICDNPIVALKRNSYKYSENQIKLRETFQKSFISYVNEKFSKVRTK